MDRLLNVTTVVAIVLAAAGAVLDSPRAHSRGVFGELAGRRGGLAGAFAARRG